MSWLCSHDIKELSTFFAHEHVIPEEQCVFNFCNNQMFGVCQHSGVCVTATSLTFIFTYCCSWNGTVYSILKLYHSHLFVQHKILCNYFLSVSLFSCAKDNCDEWRSKHWMRYVLYEIRHWYCIWSTSLISVDVGIL